MEKRPKFHIKKSKNNQFYFVLVAPNGKVVLMSETYTTKQSAFNGIRAVQKYSFPAITVDETIAKKEKKNVQTVNN